MQHVEKAIRLLTQDLEALDKRLHSISERESEEWKEA